MTDDEIKDVFFRYGQYVTGKDFALVRAIESVVAQQPAQKTWVGLTDEEHTNIQRQTHYKQFMTVSEYATLVQVAVEAKLKEKNNV